MKDLTNAKEFIKGFKRKWPTWAMPTKIGVAATIFFGLFGFFSFVIAAYDFVTTDVIHVEIKTTEEQKQEKFNQHIRDIDATISEMELNKKVVEIYHENKQDYLEYNYRFTSRFQYAALENLINSNQIRDTYLQQVLLIEKENFRRENVYLDDLDEIWQKSYEINNFDAYHGQIKNLFEDGFFKEDKIKIVNSITITLDAYKKSIDVNTFFS
ncbi:hypothetical protein KKG83_07630 [Candidatus Micrarchaeota archaeon]|nr:hypothetical protein [Candidatus Micrarchaeota archaeon]MBU2477311.1 hypothetical protein [Candidatus Micrarchaeota archaeon]